jgi:predicted TIM-barrel fold metal-dependent hydrolase
VTRWRQPSVGIARRPGAEAAGVEAEVGALGKRIVFGTDERRWPESIGMAIEAIQSAGLLTAEQKRDILYLNAARFLRLTDEEMARHHGR